MVAVFLSVAAAVVLDPARLAPIILAGAGAAIGIARALGWRSSSELRGA